ncbi:MAG: arylsulfatase A-like enzyme [Planctomycetota bacterium]|jgi:arylsulfatase A-like enzyme
MRTESSSSWRVGSVNRWLPTILGLAFTGFLSGCAEEREPSVTEVTSATASSPIETPIILIVIDTLRADHLGCYGYELDTSPVLDEFASHATVFENNSTQVNVTYASLTSILTGLYARSHRSYLPIPSASGHAGSNHFIGAAELLQAANYHTLGVVSHPTWQKDDVSPILRGWDHLSTIVDENPGADHRKLANGEHTNARLFPRLAEYEARQTLQPLFLWAHYFDPHTDLLDLVYDAPESTRNLFLKDHLTQLGLEAFESALRDLNPAQRNRWIPINTKGKQRKQLRMANGRSLYDAEIRSCDAYIGELFDRLRKMDLYERSLIVVMADHGENMEAASPMREKLLFTHHRLFQGVTRTPLIVKLPFQKSGKRVAALSQNIDVFPTILELTGLARSEQAEGKSLVPLLIDSTSAIHKRVFMESSDHLEKAIKTAQIKFIDPGDGSDFLAFRWPEDPTEMREMVSEMPAEQIEAARLAISKFAPPPKLRLRFEPESAPYSISFSLTAQSAIFESADGPGQLQISDDRHTITGSASVEAEPIEFEFTRSRGRSKIIWDLEREDEERLVKKIFVGTTSLAASGAFPIYTTTSGQTALPPQFRFTNNAQIDITEAEVSLESPARIVLVLQVENPSYEFRLEVLESKSFARLKPRGGRFVSVGSKAASIKTRVQPSESELFPLCLIDGKWPDARRVMFNGKPVDTKRAAFFFPRIPSANIKAALNSAEAGREALPGSVTIWESGGLSENELDTSEMDPGLVDDLRALGYVK